MCDVSGDSSREISHPSESVKDRAPTTSPPVFSKEDGEGERGGGEILQEKREREQGSRTRGGLWKESLGEGLAEGGRTAREGGRVKDGERKRENEIGF